MKTLAKMALVSGMLSFLLPLLSCSSFAQSSGGQIKGTVVDFTLSISLTEGGHIVSLSDTRAIAESSRILLWVSEDLRTWRRAGEFKIGSRAGLAFAEQETSPKSRFYRASILPGPVKLPELEEPSLPLDFEIFRDRGAIDRADFAGAASRLREAGAVGGLGGGLPGEGDPGGIAPPLPYPASCGGSGGTDSTTDTDSSGPGTMIGVTSSTTMQQTTPVNASFCVKAEGSNIPALP